MRSWLKGVFIVDAVVGVILGLALYLVPGRFLGLFGWAPIDPIISRILGAATLAFAWSSYTGWRLLSVTGEGIISPADRAQIRIRLEMDVIFTLLGAAGVLRHLLFGSWPWYAWTLFAGLSLFALAFIGALLGNERTPGRE